MLHRNTSLTTLVLEKDEETRSRSASIMYRARMPLEWIEKEPYALTQLAEKRLKLLMNK